MPMSTKQAQVAGSVQSIADNGGLLRGAGGGSRSTQSDSDRGWDGNTVLSPPYDLNQLSQIYEQDNIARKCIDIFGNAVFANGYEIVSTKDDDPKVQEIKDFLENCNPDSTLIEVLQAMAVDYKCTGSAGIEVARNQGSKLPELLFHMPITTLRVAKGDKKKKFKTGQRFVQLEDKKWDSHVWYNRYHPEADKRTAEYGYGEDLNGDGEVTNEIMWFRSRNPRSRHYGISPSVTLLETYLITKYAKEFNVDQFENGMLQKFMILVSGGKLSKESVAGLRAFLDDVSGRGKWNEVPILRSTAPKSTVEIKNLSGEQLESSFLDTLRYNREEVYIAFGVSPILLSIVENATLANQTAQERKFWEAEVRPFEKIIEARFNKMFTHEFGAPEVTIRAITPKFEDQNAKDEIEMKQSDRGILTINEIREAHGREPIEGGDVAFIITPVGPILVEDIPALKAEMAGENAAQKMGQVIAASLTNFKSHLEDQTRKAKILDGTEEGDDEYPDANKVRKALEDEKE